MSSPPAPRVSVLLPCRDAESYLDDCIASIRAQTEPRFEVLVVDDGSTDGTVGLLADWAETDSRVRPVWPDERGLVPALNAMADAARAPLLARMDADDIARPERLARQIALLDHSPSIAACGTGVHYFPRDEMGSGYHRYETWLNGLTDSSRVARDLYVECPIAHPTLMIRRDIFREVGGYRDFEGPEDYDLVLRVAAAGHALSNVPEVLHEWRLGGHRHSERSSRYSGSAFRGLKVEYLGSTASSVVDLDRPVVVWGAGKVGKAFARAWLDGSDRPIEAFVDLDPRKIGQEIHGARVIDPEALAERFAASGPRPWVLIGVGSPGAREEIREALEGMGATEPEDAVAVA